MSKKRSALTSTPENKTMERQQRRLSRQQKVLTEKIEQYRETPIRQSSLKSIKPITGQTDAQIDALNALNDTSIDGVVLFGSAGTGKSFVSIANGLQRMLEGEFDKVIIVRSIVSVRDIGFLPGTAEEKMLPYELPVIQICTELTGRKDAYEKLKEQGKVEFIPTSFIRGVTIRNSFIVFDEAQNCTWSEINSVCTRLGENSKLVVCGDTKQNDLTKNKNDTSGFYDFLTVASKMPEFRAVRFTRDDIVRSEFVKSWIVACESIGL